MANIQIYDLRPVEADLPVLSLTDKELLVVSGGDMWTFITTKGTQVPISWEDAW
ncbi:hypothetical protein H6G97_45645 [Nostoc flagelliforme FACHB-838]|uniref:Uncharacterized protein n=1 Tax=Nostoc flagelliforme FACHB-838 TaxID=2692904 RepID=A0ABR8E524_9NOSO|nr:hypothetical protein [Nostoc flagelliforme]MBD2536201.1 hypothetical protein [Nostoc flagelliforme FACHB-838]